MNGEKKPHAGTRPAAASKALTDHLTERLARPKAMLTEFYCVGALSFLEAEGIARRMRRRYAYSWAAA